MGFKGQGDGRSKGSRFEGSWEELKMRYMETSAKTGENVEETFMLTAREIKAKGVPKPKPSAAQTVNTAAAPEQKPGKGCAC